MAPTPPGNTQDNQIQQRIFRFLRSLAPAVLVVDGGLGKSILAASGYYRMRTRLAARGANVDEINLYRPLYSPWDGQAEFMRYYDQIKPHTMVSADRCWILLHFLRHSLELAGDFIECGVFRGGTALLAAEVLRKANDRRPLHLFDSFSGMPDTLAGDTFSKGDFGNTSEATVRALLAPTKCDIRVHSGYMPDTFVSADISQVAYAHIDVDLYKSVCDCVEFVYPRLVPGGVMIFDDYGFPSCWRSREAVNHSFASKREKPIYLPTGQALVLKLP